MGMLPPDCLKPDGTERDAEDSRSLHFAVLARAGGRARVVASMRAIRKSAAPLGALPVERLFPEAFADGPAPEESVELSRLISRHEDQDVKAWLTWALFAAALPYAADYGFPPIFAAIRPFLADRLAADGVPIVRIADPLLIPEYGGDYVAVSIRVNELAREAAQGQLQATTVEGCKLREFTYLQAPPSLATTSQRGVTRPARARRPIGGKASMRYAALCLIMGALGLAGCGGSGVTSVSHSPGAEVGHTTTASSRESSSEEDAVKAVVARIDRAAERNEYTKLCSYASKSLHTFYANHGKTCEEEYKPQPGEPKTGSHFSLLASTIVSVKISGDMATVKAEYQEGEQFAQTETQYGHLIKEEGAWKYGPGPAELAHLEAATREQG